MQINNLLKIVTIHGLGTFRSGEFKTQGNNNTIARNER